MNALSLKCIKKVFKILKRTTHYEENGKNFETRFTDEEIRMTNKHENMLNLFILKNVK